MPSPPDTTAMDQNILVNTQRPQDSPSGFFHNAHHFTVNNPTLIDITYPHGSHLIGLLAQHTIQGAEFDSSERYPPPRCHPGTRLQISRNFQAWIHNTSREKKFVWLHGPAGVGKSAIIQTLAETESDSPTSVLGATLFFSRLNERDDPQRVFTTIAYQLTVKYPVYRKYVLGLLSVNPKLVGKSLVEQFKWFIVKPFVEQKLFDGLDHTVLMMLDGLDECMGESVQHDIVLLIGRFVSQHPEAPLIWIIASRPEPHLRVAFSSQAVRASFLDIQVPHNSNQACSDVERFLRDEFNRIREAFPASFPRSVKQWPSETDFGLLATRASGLFIFAAIVVRYVDKVAYGNPISQLQKVLKVIDFVPQSKDQVNPFTALDALYSDILATIPQDVLPVTQEVLTFSLPRTPAAPLDVLGNWLGLSQADVYGSLQRLHPVLNIPSIEDASKKLPLAFHASFIDYLTSPTRSGRFYIDPVQARRKVFWIGHRVLMEAVDTSKPTVLAVGEDTRIPAGSDIQVSRIKLAWEVEDPEQYQQRIFSLSLNYILMIAPETIDKTVWDGFGRLYAFFRALDFRERFSKASGALTHLISLCYTAFRPRFEEWRFLQRVPIQSLEWDRIDLSDQTRIHWYISNAHEMESFQEKMKWDWDSSGVYFISGYNFVEEGEYMCHGKILHLSDDLEWETRIRQHLATLAKSVPSLHVELVGRGDKSLAFVQVEYAENPHEMWEYLFPYNQS